MGYALYYAPCIACGRIFGFNPFRVPSLRRTPQSELEPICQNCVPLINRIRAEHGLPLIVPHPEAYQAYDEAELD